MEDLLYSDLRALLEFVAAASPGALKEPEKLALILLCGLMRWTPSPMRSGAPAALGLTPRESEVMAWVVRGESNPQIAKRLSIAPGTVKKHLEHVYAKLGVKTRTEAAVRVAPYFGFSFSD